MVIVLLGPPGAGKGTQGERLAARLAIPKIATGDVLRAAVKDGTPMGLQAKAVMERGDLVPDSVIMGIMKEALSQPSAATGVILDGVVRTTPQAVGLSTMLRELGRQVDHVLLFDIADDELVLRLSGRTVCEACQRPFFGREPGESCDVDGQQGKLIRRADDEPAAVRKRLMVYRDQTAPVIDWYRAAGDKLRTIDASGSLEEVEARALKALGHATPGHATPGHATPGPATPGHPAPGHPAPVQATPGHATPGQTTPIQNA